MSSSSPISKPTFILTPPKDPQWNYVVDILTKWYQRYFYFGSTYRCPNPNCISEFFESRFARLEYVGNRKFNLAYMRHAGQWWGIFQGLSLQECLERSGNTNCCIREFLALAWSQKNRKRSFAGFGMFFWRRLCRKVD